jgi:hypothetical protein
MHFDELKAGVIIRGPALPEPIQILAVIRLGEMYKVDGRGLQMNQFHQRILHPGQLDGIMALPIEEPFDGDPLHFKLGIEAARLGLAYEYDPYFSLSIARVDPLPHQLEAVYDYFLKLPRIRFLLAHDPGAGKTIMAGLLLKELRIRGLVKRTLIVAPANLTFQRQRELKDKRSPDPKERGLKLRPRKCLHVYKHLVHPSFGFMNARIQTWFPSTCRCVSMGASGWRGNCGAGTPVLRAMITVSPHWPTRRWRNA